MQTTEKNDDSRLYAKFDYQQNIRKLKLWFSHIDALYLYSACVCMRHFLRVDWSSFLALRFSQAFGQLIHITATSLSLLGASESGKASAEMRARKAGCRRVLKGGHSIWSCSTAWLHKSHNTLRHNMANNAKCKNDMSNDVRDALAAPIPLLLAPVGNIGARDSRDACGRCEAIR